LIRPGLLRVFVAVLVVAAYGSAWPPPSLEAADCGQPPTVPVAVNCRYEFVLSVFVDAERLNDRNAKVEAWINGFDCTQLSYADRGPNDTPQTGLFYHVAVFASTDRAECGESGRLILWRLNGRESNDAFPWPSNARAFPPYYSGYPDVFFGPVPMVLEGNVYRAPPDPRSASEARTVEAFVEGKRCGTGIFSGFSAQMGGGDRYDGLVVRPEAVETGCGRDGATVLIKVGGVPAGNLIYWRPGRPHCCDISLETAARVDGAVDSRSDRFVWFGAGVLTAAAVFAVSALGLAFRRRR